MAARKQPQLARTGSRAPDVKLEQIEGDAVALQDLIDRAPSLLVFFKVTCPVCQFALPFIERLHASGKLTVYGVSQNDTSDTVDFTQRFGVTFPILMDTEDSGFPVSNAYGISSVPTGFLIERDGTISRIMEGWNKKDFEWFSAKAAISPFREGDRVPEWKAG